jgi:hypothetical protein
VTPEPQDGVLVDSGSFKVDRARALDKLMRFQLADARMYMLPWVQAAVAAEAEFIRFRGGGGELVMEFGGRAWTPEELGDPYRWLFEEDADGRFARNRALAIGILSALRLSPRAIAISSFQDGVETVLRIKDPTSERVERAPYDPAALKSGAGGGPAPSLRIRVGLFPPYPELDYVRRACRHCPVRITAGTETLNPEPEGEGIFRRAFVDGRFSGALWLSPTALADSRIDLVAHGVTTTGETLRLKSLQVCGFVRNDDFRKSLSQMTVVKDELYQKAFELVRLQADALLADAVAELKTADLAAVGQALRRTQNRWRWMPWLGRSLGETLLYGVEDTLSAPERDSAGGEAIARTSLLVAALRTACLLRKDEMLSESAAPVARDLGNAGLLFDTQFRPLSVFALRQQSRWMGQVPYSRSPSPTPTTLAAFVLRDEDLEFLKSFFEGDLRPLDAADAADRKALPPVLQDENLLARLSFRTKTFSAEIGLSLTPHPTSSRVRWIREGRPLSVSPWPLDGLRLEAVVDAPGFVDAPTPGSAEPAATAFLAALRATAPALYERAAQDYVPSEVSPKQALLREHLLDLAAASWDRAREQWTVNAWLDGLALFRDDAGRMISMGELRARAASGAKAALSASPHPDALQAITEGYPDHIHSLFASSTLIRGIVEPRGPEPEKEPVAKPRPPEKTDVAELPKSAPVEGAAAPAEAPPPAPAPAVRFEVAAPARRPDPPSPKPGDGAPDPLFDAAEKIKDLLRALTLKNACPLSPEQIDSFRLVAAGRGAALLRKDAQGRLTLNADHALARALGAPERLPSRAPLLVSILLTGLRRARLAEGPETRAQTELVGILLGRPDSA